MFRHRSIENVSGSKEVLDNSERPENVSNYSISKFKLSRILCNNTISKSIVLLGTFPEQSDTNPAIILLEKEGFKESEVQTHSVTENSRNGVVVDEQKMPTYFNDELKVRTEFINNIYGSFKCTPNADINSVKTIVIYPATEKHIEKYSICRKFVTRETPSMYENVTLPFIESSKFSLDWVYNILEHKQETERIVYEDNDAENGFILLPDLKWDGSNINAFYLLAIVHKRDIKSLRDLTAEHLPLLRNIRRRSAEAIEEKYSLSPNQLRMYFHYQPSFYHLHIHINPILNDAIGIRCEKAHMLDTVINNIELMSDYYQRATLPFILHDGSKLHARYKEELTFMESMEFLEDANKEQQEQLGD